MEESRNHESADETQKVEMDNGNEMARESVTEDDYEHLQQTQLENESSHSVVKSEEFVTEIPVMNSAASYYATQLEPKIENIMSSSSDEHGGISLVVSDLVPKEIEPSLEKEVLPASDEKVQVPGVEASNGGEDCSMSLVPKGIETQELEEEEVLPASDENIGEFAHSLEPKKVPGADAISSGTDNGNMSQDPKDIENKPIIASTLKARTSWMDCCGLFDYLKRSN